MLLQARILKHGKLSVGFDGLQAGATWMIRPAVAPMMIETNQKKPDAESANCN
jgi:hypothetical protein